MHKSGFVNIIGNPNVGKSTLMNALVGEKLSIITSKAQTTRHRIMGIVSSEDFQIVYSDTPGILKPSYKLQESMMKFVTGAVADADVILYVTDTVERGTLGRNHRPHPPERRSGHRGHQQDRPHDARGTRGTGRQMAGELPEARIVPASAKENFNIEGLFKTILDLLPEGPAFYPKDTLTDKTLRFSPRKSSARKSSGSTTRRSPTAAKSRSKATRRSRRSTASPQRSMSPATRRKAS